MYACPVATSGRRLIAFRISQRNAVSHHSVDHVLGKAIDLPEFIHAFKGAVEIAMIDNSLRQIRLQAQDLFQFLFARYIDV